MPSELLNLWQRITPVPGPNNRQGTCLTRAESQEQAERQWQEIVKSDKDYVDLPGKWTNLGKVPLMKWEKEYWERIHEREKSNA